MYIHLCLTLNDANFALDNIIGGGFGGLHLGKVALCPPGEWAFVGEEEV
jgi:hypothetical protein